MFEERLFRFATVDAGSGSKAQPSGDVTPTHDASLGSHTTRRIEIPAAQFATQETSEVNGEAPYAHVVI